ncbi:MAG: helicase [Pseudomonas sp.]|nr:helicase [Pseudomonas sp.]
MSIKIEAVIARKIGFASHQNAVPLVRELSIWNQGEQSFQTSMKLRSTCRDWSIRPCAANLLSFRGRASLWSRLWR